MGDEHGDHIVHDLLRILYDFPYEICSVRFMNLQHIKGIVEKKARILNLPRSVKKLRLAK